MKIFVGYIFTETPIANLRQRGFDFLKEETNHIRGYRAFKLKLSGGVIELREVIDEDIYFKFNHKKSFEPFVENCLDSQTSKLSENKNSVESVVQSYTLDQIETQELHDYLRLRKEFTGLVALGLCAKDVQVFNKVANPDKQFVLDKNQVSLIHTGPNCFDFIIFNQTF